MAFEKELTCPHCRSTNVDPVAFVYSTLKSKEAGKKIFLDERIGSYKTHLTARQKKNLESRFTPPKEPKRSLPAGIITLTALLLSWLFTLSLVAGKVGQREFFWTAFTTTFLIGIPFFAILQLVIKDFSRRILKYRRLMDAWNKQYFCNDCHEVFVPQKKDYK